MPTSSYRPDPNKEISDRNPVRHLVHRQNAVIWEPACGMDMPLPHGHYIYATIRWGISCEKCMDTDRYRNALLEEELTR